MNSNSIKIILIASTCAFLPLSASAGDRLKAAIQSANVSEVKSLLKTNKDLDYMNNGGAIKDAIDLNERYGDRIVHMVHVLLMHGAKLGTNSEIVFFELIGKSSKKTISLRARLMGLLVTYADQSYGMPNFEPMAIFINPELPIDIFVAYCSAIPPAERQALEKKYDGLIHGLATVRRNLPIRDLRKMISRIVMAPLVDEHMENIRHLVDDAYKDRQGMFVSHGNDPAFLGQIQFIERIKNNPDFWKTVRERAEINIRRTLFNPPEHQDPWSGPKSELTHEHEQTVNDFVRAYEKWRASSRDNDDLYQ